MMKLIQMMWIFAVQSTITCPRTFSGLVFIKTIAPVGTRKCDGQATTSVLFHLNDTYCYIMQHIILLSILHFNRQYINFNETILYF